MSTDTESKSKWFRLSPLSVQQALAYGAMVAAGIDEMPLAIMRHDRFKRLMRDNLYSPGDRIVLDKLGRGLAAGASLAHKRLRDSPSVSAYWQTRQAIRSMGGDATKARRPPRSAATAPSTMLTQLEIQERTAELEELTLEQWARANRQEMHSPADLRTEAVAQRREHRLYLKKVRDARDAVERRNSRQAAERAREDAELSTLYDRDPAPVAMRGAAFQSLPVAERARQDVLAITRQGRKVPIASSHPLAHVPLWKRPGLR